jgi:2-dehydro-3-deoxyphosphogalactonate aldolase
MPHTRLPDAPDADFRRALDVMPLVAILRGLRPVDAVGAGSVLRDAGFRLIEVPLNSPEPLKSIEALASALPDCVIGAGTVLSAADVRAIRDSGGRLVVAPNVDADVLGEALALGIPAVPGVATPSEAFAALRAGAAALKLFPAEAIGPEVLKAWRAVIPTRVGILPVGGITPARMRPYLEAGATGFGLGSALYRPADPLRMLGERAADFVRAWQEASSS